VVAAQASLLILVLQDLLSFGKCISFDQNNRSKNCFSLKRLRDDQRGISEHKRNKFLYYHLFHMCSTCTRIGFHASNLCASMCTDPLGLTCTACHFRFYIVSLGTLRVSSLSLIFSMTNQHFVSLMPCVVQSNPPLKLKGLLISTPSSTVGQLKTVCQLRLSLKKDLPLLVSLSDLGPADLPTPKCFKWSLKRAFGLTLRFQCWQWVLCAQILNNWCF
jgi:hypothetical protein